MAQKPKTQYVCAECGATSPKWAGQCGECGAWNSLTEQAAPTTQTRRGGHYAGAEGARRLGDVKLEKTPRQATGLDELDRVLGGGLVPGSVILLGGDPG
ncbi:MAG: DNA repair protein RadA, partial [Halothiobacillaceae bacterium]